MNKIGLKNAGVRVQLQAAAARPRLFAFHIIIQAFHTPGFSYSRPPPHLNIISRGSFIFNHTRQSTQLSKNDRDQKRRKQKENFWDYSPQQASKVCQFLSLKPYPEILKPGSPWNSTETNASPAHIGAQNWKPGKNARCVPSHLNFEPRALICSRRRHSDWIVGICNTFFAINVVQKGPHKKHKK